MHGKISLESRLSGGTTATFSIPFNKPQFQGAGVPLMEASALPDRLQSELSLSCNTSSNDRDCVTPPISSPLEQRHGKVNLDKHVKAIDSALQKTTSPVSSPGRYGEHERSKLHVLVVEDKYVYQS
jgi:hypothetical protein